MDTGVEVRTMENDSQEPFAVQAVLRFSPDFTLEQAAWASGWIAGYRQLEKAGKLDHTVAECPERDRPPHVREWTPDGGWRDLTPPIPAAAPAEGLGRPGRREASRRD
jgi:hypothetical protein